MEIYEGEMIGADGKIALIVNSIEDLIITEPNEKNFKELIARLKDLLIQFPENVRRYIDEIHSAVEVTIKYYKEQGVRTPDTSFLYK